MAVLFLVFLKYISIKLSQLMPWSFLMSQRNDTLMAVNLAGALRS